MILRGAVRSRLCNTQWAPSILTSSKRNNPPNARSDIMNTLRNVAIELVCVLLGLYAAMCVIVLGYVV